LCAISNFALVGVLIYVETSFPDLGILDNPILTAIVLVAVFGIGILDHLDNTFCYTTIPKFKNRRFVLIFIVAMVILNSKTVQLFKSKT
jgi:predicted small integral membrane protein